MDSPGTAPIIIQGTRVKCQGSNENTHIHTGSEAHTAGRSCVFMGLSTHCPVLAMGQKPRPFLYQPKDTAGGPTQGGQVVSTHQED